MSVRSDEATSSEQVVDEWLRRISDKQICQRVQLLWSAMQERAGGEVDDMTGKCAVATPCCTSARQTKPSYIHILLYSARAIQVMIDENAAAATPDAHRHCVTASSFVWCSYLRWFARVLFAKPHTEAEARYVARRAYATLCAVMAFPRTAVNLRENYLDCVKQQRGASQHTHIVPPPAPLGRQDLWGAHHTTTDTTTAAATMATATSSAAPSDATHAARGATPRLVFDVDTNDGLDNALTALPPHMTLPHRNGTIHLQLFNPLPIPHIHFIRSGYRCDGCRVSNMHVGYQAVPYNEATEAAREQRNDAHFVGATRFGYDLCIACAVRLFCTQHTRLRTCLSAPYYTPFSANADCAVSVLEVVSKRTVHEDVVPCAHAMPRGEADHGDERAIEAETRWTAASTLTYSSSYTIATCATAPVFGAAPVVSEGDLRRCRTAVPPPPPRRRPSRRRLATTRTIDLGADVLAPSSRCRVRTTTQVTLRVAVAPRAARAMAWVVTGTERDSVDDGGTRPRVETDEDGSDGVRGAVVARAPYEPPVDWQTFVRVRHVAVSGEAGQSDQLTLPATSVCATEEESNTRDTSAARTTETERGDGVGDAECCVVCLSPLRNGMPVLTTRCGHMFHVECIQEQARVSHDVCPLCRKAGVLPDMGVQSALRENVYEVQVTLTERQARSPHPRICVASLLTSNGHYYNVTNIAAAQCVAIE